MNTKEIEIIEEMELFEIIDVDEKIIEDFKFRLRDGGNCDEEWL